ncbi:MAG: AI-2E family transporter [Termitinemataceae bacterium]
MRDRNNVQTWFFLGVFILLFLGVLRIFAPFFTVFLWATLVYILINPLFSWITVRIPKSVPWNGLAKSLLAAIISILTVSIIVGILFWIGFQLYNQLLILIKMFSQYLSKDPHYFSQEFERLTLTIKDLTFGQIDLASLDIKSQILQLLKNSTQRLFQVSTTIVKDVGSFAAGLAFFVFTLFFFLIDGPYLFDLIMKGLPIKKEYIMNLAGKFREITHNLFMGYILVALVQASVAFILFSIFQVQGALVFSVVLFFCTFIPIIGAGTIWGPIGLFKILSGDVAGGIVFLILSGILISTLDNLLRPLFLKDRINLHPLVIFFSILGGVAAFGLNGLVLGPIVVILFLTVLDLFLVEHGIAPDRNE